ncbi:hypothetical protein [Mesorhizobium sp. 113-3-3]|uniref:hypothetical protein n=1 Tax=Mesorhizobium sp. 113-3-3 TaxID=2744516 RepID=UPI001925E2E0|nr:hypothetical protein [Mesorhizobium sp. 113-3-3]
METIYVTKHCKPADREYMLSGSFRIGTHSGFYSGESTLYDDRDEGKGESNLTGDVFNLSGSIGNIVHMSGVTVVNIKNAVSYQHNVDFNVFCSSIGPYSEIRHRLLMDGRGAYTGSKSMTAWLVLDVAKLRIALEAVATHCFARTIVIEKPVSYGRRTREFSQSTIGANFATSTLLSRDIEFAFVKPSLFSVEEEYRHCMIPVGAPPEPILTNRLPRYIRRLFVQAIHDPGGIVI